MALIVKRDKDTFTFNNVSKDQLGRWSLGYHRNNTICRRPILDIDDHAIKDRKPIGQELLETAQTVLGRKLSRNEEEGILDFRVIV